MTIDFYLTALSPACRSVCLTIKALGLEVNYKYLNFANKEHMSPEFIKLNPQHSVPTIVDDNFVLWESRAIIIYLVEQYGKDDYLYPMDSKKRAIINQRLFFDMELLYGRYLDLYLPILFKDMPFDNDKAQRLDEAVMFLEGFLEQTEFVAGNNFTVADIALIATVSSIEAVGFDIMKFPKITKWFEKSKELIPDYKEVTEEVLQQTKAIYESKIKK